MERKFGASKAKIGHFVIQALDRLPKSANWNPFGINYLWQIINFFTIPRQNIAKKFDSESQGVGIDPALVISSGLSECYCGLWLIRYTTRAFALCLASLKVSQGERFCTVEGTWAVQETKPNKERHRKPNPTPQLSYLRRLRATALGRTRTLHRGRRW